MQGLIISSHNQVKSFQQFLNRSNNFEQFVAMSQGLCARFYLQEPGKVTTNIRASIFLSPWLTSISTDKVFVYISGRQFNTGLNRELKNTINQSRVDIMHDNDKPLTFLK